MNTTPHTHEVAAKMMAYGAPAADINRWMFDTISRARVELEKLALETLEFPYDGRLVLMEISREMMKQAGASGEDVEGINSIPRQIDGALVGVTIRERKIGGYKISMRSQPPVDCRLRLFRFSGKRKGTAHQSSGRLLCRERHFTSINLNVFYKSF